MFLQKCRRTASCDQRSRSCHGRLVLFTSLFCAAGMASGADLSQARLIQKRNVVTLAPNLTSEARPAVEGALIQADNVVRTGTDSLAGLEFSDLTQARLGSNALFSWDARARALKVKQGAVLFSKPPNSGPVQIEAGPVSCAIKGSTGFVSVVPIKGKGKAANGRSNGREMATILGMLEGKLQGSIRWKDSANREHTTPLNLGPGDILVARPDIIPRVAQFDLPRFVRSSPLIKGFSQPLRNKAAINKAVASYKADKASGFVESTPWDRTGTSIPIEVSVAQLTALGAPEFLNVGGTGVIRGQLVWRTDADLDLYLTLPNGQQISFRNVSVTFNNGMATATLDHQNLGNTIDVQPNIRVENIVVTGVPLSGLYNFFVNNFGTQSSSDPFTLTVNYNGKTQVITGNLGNGATSEPVIVKVPPGP